MKTSARISTSVPLSFVLFAIDSWPRHSAKEPVIPQELLLSNSSNRKLEYFFPPLLYNKRLNESQGPSCIEKRKKKKIKKKKKKKLRTWVCNYEICMQWSIDVFFVANSLNDIGMIRMIEYINFLTSPLEFFFSFCAIHDEIMKELVSRLIDKLNTSWVIRSFFPRLFSLPPCLEKCVRDPWILCWNRFFFFSFFFFTYESNTYVFSIFCNWILLNYRVLLHLEKQELIIVANRLGLVGSIMIWGNKQKNKIWKV